MRTSGTGARRWSVPRSGTVGGLIRRSLPARRYNGVGSEASRAAGGAVATSADPGDRGDVPGWVLVTLMTAGLVSALWLVAGDALVNLFQTAISHVAP